MSVIGDAYIEVKSKTDGFESGAESLFSGFGAKAALAFTAGFAAAGAVTKVLYDIGASFDSAFDTIRVGTGKTGQALADLQGSFKRVAVTGPESFGEVSSTITALTQKLGLTGKPLEDLSRQFLDLSHITGTDVAANVKTVTDLFNNFGVAASDQGAKLDDLFRATQVSGSSITDLASQMSGAGVQLRSLGFDFDQATALIAGLAKQGLSASDVMPALAKTMAVAAKSGKDAGTVFRDLVKSIKDAPTTEAAASIAFDALGAKAGPRLAGLIREGKLSFEDLQKAIAGGSDTISKATSDTADFSEKFDTFKNRVLVGLEPIATKVFTALGDGMDRLIPILTDLFGKAQQVFNVIFHGDFTSGPFAEDSPFIATLFELREKYLPGIVAAFEGVSAAVGAVASFIGDNLQPILIGLGGAMLLAAGPAAILAAGFIYAYNQSEAFRDVVGTVVTWLTDVAAPAVADFAAYVIASFSDLVAWVQQYWPQISEAIGHVMRVVQEVVGVVVDFVATLWRAWGDDLLHMAKTIWGYIRETISNGVNFIQGIIQTVLAVINGDWGKAWDGIKQAAGAVWDQIKNLVGTGISLVREVLAGGVSLLIELWNGLWDKVKDLAKIGWQAMVDWFKGGGLMTFAEFFLSLPNKAAEWLGDLIHKMLELGGQVIGGLVKGVVDKAVDFKNAVLDALSDAWDAATGWLEVSSPSKKYAKLGAWTIQGYIDGMKSKSADVRAYLAALLNNAIQGATAAAGGIRAVFSVGDARSNLAAAQDALDAAKARQATLPGLISHQVQVVAAEKAKAQATTTDEQLAIDRAILESQRKAEAYNTLRASGKATALELRIAAGELALAEAAVTKAQQDAVGPTDELTKAEQDLKDLRDEQHDITKRLADATRDLQNAELALVDAQGQLITAGAALGGQDKLVAYFTDLGLQAGLTNGQIRDLLTNLGALGTIQGLPTAAAAAAPAPTVPGSATGHGPATSAPGSSSGGSTAGWNLAAGTGPNGIRFTPGGGGMTIAQLQALFGGTTVLAPVSYHSIDTKGLLEKMDIQAAVGEVVTKATRLRPVVA